MFERNNQLPAFYRRTLLGTAIAVAASAAAAPALAQNDEPIAEEVIVYGIRHSLETATALKRDAQVVVDAITAEDIGKFPDANVADSLQRITGVQISRDRGGEGRFVSVRGLSSQFNMTKLNGRTLATDNAGRDFSFDIMPSEAISGAEVYKTSMASLPEGSIGGLINLTTAKPLDNPGFQASGSLGALYDGATEKWGEQLSAVVSNTFMDDTVGALVGLSYYKRDWRADTFENFATGTEAMDIDGDGDRFEGEGRGVFPGIISYQTKFGERERLGFNGALQFRPSDRFETTIDAFYSDYSSPESSYSYNVNFYSNDGWGRFENTTYEPWVNAPDEENKYLLTSFDLDNIPVEIGNDTKYRETTTYMVGWNTIWQTTDSLELTFDVAYSEADRPVNAREYYTVAGVNGGNYSYTAGKVPTIECTLDDGRNCWDLTNDEIGLHFMEPKGENVNDQALSIRFDGDLELGTLAGIDTVLEFGATYSDQTKDKDIYKPNNPCNYCGFNDTLGEVGVDAVVAFPGGGYSPGVESGLSAWPALDPLALFEAARLHSSAEEFNENVGAKLQPRASSEIEEAIGGLYLQVNFTAGDLSGNLGGRWVQTDVTSNGHTQELLSLTPIPNSTNFEAEFSDVQPVSVENSYNNFLPSLNLNYQLREDTVVRFAASKTMTRPTISQLGPDVNWEVNSLPARVARNGNPNLEPIEADSLDLSFEWYGEQGSSAALALFHKEIEGFVTPAVFPEEIIGRTFEVSAPINGDTAKVTGAEVAFQHLFDNGWGAQANYTWVDSKADITVNGEKVSDTLDGVSENTYNLVGFYENDVFNARLTYSYRDDFTACSTCGPVGTRTTTKDFGSLDFSTSYDISENFAVYLEGQNLLEDDTHTYFGDVRATGYYEAYARRFEVGVRARY